jgi:hypothetical protein
MSENCFVKQEANSKLIDNVVSFCSKCYNNIVENEIIFYDMKNYCYLCESCQSELAENLDINCEPLDSNNNSLFS